MKQLKLLLLGTVSALLMLFVVFVPMRANAATIANGVPNTLQREGKAFYKITLDKDSLVEINWVKNNNDLAKVFIYADRQKTELIQENFINSKSGKICIPLKRGTYYVDMYDGATGKAPAAKVKFAWTPATKYDRGNFSLAKAYELKRNTVEEVVQIRTCNYKRWYKIKLTKDQKVTFTFKNPYSGNNVYYSEIYPVIKVAFYNSKLERLTFSSYYSNTGQLTFDDVFPKGTYYIVVASTEDSSVRGDYVSFSWK